MNADKKKQRVYWQTSFCINLGISIGLIIFFASNQAFGYWIPMTIGILFTAVDQGQGTIIRNVVSRIIGTIFGACLVFLYANLLMANDYRWMYFFIVIWFAGNYFAGVTNNYIISVTVVTMQVPLMYAVSGKAAFIESGLSTTLFMRLYFTLVAAIIVIIALYLFYRKQLSTGVVMQEQTKNIFKTQAEIYQLVFGYFCETVVDDNELSVRIGVLISAISAIENMYLNINYELDFSAENKHQYECIFLYVGKFIDCSKKLLCIAQHDDYSNTIANKEELKLLINELSDKYTNINDYFNGKTDNLSERIATVLANVSLVDKFLPEYLFIKIIGQSSTIVDELAYEINCNN
jgi:hypothetical protein